MAMSSATVKMSLNGPALSQSPNLFSLSLEFRSLKFRSLKFIFTCLRFSGIEIDVRHLMDWTNTSGLHRRGYDAAVDF